MLPTSVFGLSRVECYRLYIVSAVILVSVFSLNVGGYPFMFTLNMATAVIAETSHNLLYSTQLIPRKAKSRKVGVFQVTVF